MNTVEPDIIKNNRSKVQDLMQSTFGGDNNNVLNDPYFNAELNTYRDIELAKTEWFINILKEESISNEEEKKLKVWKELDIFGYDYIGEIKVNKYLFKLLYYLKLIKL